MSSGRLVTNNSRAKRQYNGPGEGPPPSDEPNGAVIHARGLRAIIQPGDAYFRGADYFKGGSRGPWRRSSGPAAYHERALRPMVEEVLPAFAQEERIWAWSPTEELPAESEAAMLTPRAFRAASFMQA